MIGDVVGRPGRRAVRKFLPGLRARRGVDLVIANGENASGGWGLNLASARELYEAGVDCLTSGNHIWREKGVLELLEKDARLIRPLNYPAGAPGRGWGEFGGVLVVNLLGRVFMDQVDCPFQVMDNLLESYRGGCKGVVVDIHAEATSEKMALGWHLAGRVSAVLGTHTHVPTADARLLANGTAYVSDVGMAGPRDGVIGMEAEAVVERFVRRLPVQFGVAKGPVVFQSVLIEVDAASGQARKIERLDLAESEDGEGHPAD